MYDYIFWVIYSRNINRNKSKWLSRNNASGVVFFALLVHIVLILSISKWLSGAKLDLEYLTANKWVTILGVLMSIWATYLYYTDNRINKIKRRQLNAKNTRRNNALLVLLIIFVPLTIIIVMGWKGVSTM